MTFLNRLWQPSAIIGILLVVGIWTATAVKVRNSIETTRKDTINDILNFGRLLEQDYLRASEDFDRTIQYLRRTYERNGHRADWPRLLQEDFTADKRTAQIAVIDSAGRMITSSAMLHPTTSVDLSDREHFKFHREATSDHLHVSRPVIGRASGKWSIQFTRGFKNANGEFAGVLVVSLDPDLLLSAYSRLDAPHGSGFALIGKDDIVRAGVGSFAGKTGSSYVDDMSQSEIETDQRFTKLFDQLSGGKSLIVGMRAIGDTGITVVITIPAPSPYRALDWNNDYLLAVLGSIIVLTALASSLTRQRRHLQQITNLAHIDSLTKLPNRLEFRKELSDRLKTGKPFALHLIDLDRFKAVNDTYGHPLGDELLCAVASRLTANVRKTDLVFRLGGDEFALLQSDCTTRDQNEAVARRICRVIADPFRISTHEIHIGASLGIATPTAELSDDVALLKAADIALYAVKGNGRGSYCIYGPELNVTLLKRQKLESDMRAAIVNGEFEMHYQRKVLLSGDRQTTGYEALVRWNHPDRGMVPPNDFIGIAEESGLIVQLGKWILSEVCREFAARPNEGTVAVNVSAVQFSRDDVAASVHDALAISGLAADRLEIELTESSLMRNEKTIVAQLERMRASGVKISLDDFGTGYSSLGYLERYPIDCIKIDRSFVAKLCTDNKAAAVTRAIVTLSRELGMSTVAEGVEQEDQLEALRLLGCTAAQGYLLGRPAPARQLWREAA